MKQVYILFKGEKEVCRGSLMALTNYQVDNVSPKYARKEVAMYLPNVDYKKVRKETMGILHGKLSYTRRMRLNKELSGGKANV